MIQDQNVLPLFAIPMCRTKIDPVNENTVDYLKNRIDYNMMRPNSYNSANMKILDDPMCQNLRTVLLQQVEDFMKYLDVDTDKQKFYITTSWMNKYSHHEDSHQHFHSNSLISGVLYFEDCNDTAGISFHKRQGWDSLFQYSVNLDFKSPKSKNSMAYLYNESTVTVKPQKWDLLMFPSILNHSVQPNQSTEKVRYSLAFNTFIRGTVGDSGSQLDLK